MATDKRKVWFGALLLVVSSILIFVSGPFSLGISATAAGIAAGVAALGMAAGALLVGTSEDGRPV
ncbi:hypothetical protein NDI56_01125 [Haloarcula sp. S1CR25-12]|uniref:Uncharacterized protein n=1 Tax=Haloarcula saliterrae TaxID=2950534 RepID=A0ABU2F6Z3_9EURY|nr:hypothetical protein [Haloarcula sp. S1CR25-12]MDS0258004.1 hypothetical protein [Haloarcula sp. S1CR25-12]